MEDTPTLSDRLRDNAKSATVDAITSAMCVDAADHIDGLEADLGHAAFFGPLPTPAERFAKWCQEGPALAKAAGLYVGIKVTPAQNE